MEKTNNHTDFGILVLSTDKINKRLFEIFLRDIRREGIKHPLKKISIIDINNNTIDHAYESIDEYSMVSGNLVIAVTALQLSKDDRIEQSDPRNDVRYSEILKRKNVKLLRLPASKETLISEINNYSL